MFLIIRDYIIGSNNSLILGMSLKCQILSPSLNEKLYNHLSERHFLDNMQNLSNIQRLVTLLLTPKAFWSFFRKLLLPINMLNFKSFNNIINLVQVKCFYSFLALWVIRKNKIHIVMLINLGRKKTKQGLLTMLINLIMIALISYGLDF